MLIIKCKIINDIYTLYRFLRSIANWSKENIGTHQIETKKKKVSEAGLYITNYGNNNRQSSYKNQSGKENYN